MLVAGHNGPHTCQQVITGSEDVQWANVPPGATIIREDASREAKLPDDPINHPKHYNSHPSGIECIVIAEHHNFSIGSALKYLWRQGLKEGNSPISELKKAAWYIQREIERLEKP
jgi:hypothetical protein